MALAETNPTPTTTDVVELTNAESIALLIDRVPAYPDATKAADLLVAAKAIKSIDDAQERDLVAAHATELAKSEKAIESHYEPYCKAFHQLHRASTATRKNAVDALTVERNRLDRMVLTWEREAERKRREEEARLRREAEERARREREEMERQAQEEAAKLEAAGKTEEAEAVIEQATVEAEIIEAQPIAAPVLPAQPKLDRAAGATVRKTYKALVVDMEALVKAAAENPAAYMQYLLPNETALNGAARIMKDKLAIPGVKCDVTESLSHSRR